MRRILIVDDNVEKINRIVRVINEINGDNYFEIKTANYCNDAKVLLAENSYDVLILDICLPERLGDDLKADAGIVLLKQIKGSSRYTYPKFVIALSAYEEMTKEFEVEDGMIHSVFVYDESTNEWKVKLKKCVADVDAILSRNISKRAYDYDIAVICALKEELELVKSECEMVQEIKVPDDDYIYYEGTMNSREKKIHVVMTQSSHMGMVPAATLTTKLIYNFCPRYLVMTGITAGIKGKVKMGDVIVAEYVWDYGAGKETIADAQSIHKNTIQQIQIDTELASMVKRFSENEETLVKIKKSFNGEKPESELRLHLGAVASGAAVVADPTVIQKILDGQIRDVIAVEMEIYGVYYAARWSVNPKPKVIALKSVCDFADANKDDRFHVYASYTSAKVLTELAKNYFRYE